MPWRGFAVLVKVKISATSNQSCEIFITAYLMPIGRNMSDQEAVHKADMEVNRKVREIYFEVGEGCHFSY